MTGRTERRVREIRRRTRQYRKRHERRVLSTLSVCSLLLFAEIGILLRKVQSGGVPTVADSYGSVLLRGGASAYIVVGIAAFAVGVTVTMICIRCKKKKRSAWRMRKIRRIQHEETTAQHSAHVLYGAETVGDDSVCNDPYSPSG